MIPVAQAVLQNPYLRDALHRTVPQAARLEGLVGENLANLRLAALHAQSIPTLQSPAGTLHIVYAGAAKSMVFFDNPIRQLEEAGVLTKDATLAYMRWGERKGSPDEHKLLVISSRLIFLYLGIYKPRYTGEAVPSIALPD